MIAGIQYNYYVGGSFNKTFFIQGGFETHKVYLDMGCFESQFIYPVVIWKIKNKNVFRRIFSFLFENFLQFFVSTMR